MNKTTEALKLAEEALVKANHFHDYEDALVAVREALAKQDKHEPVAVISESAIGLVKLHSNGACLPFGTQLYAAPVERQWVDLTDDEIDESYEQAGKALRRWQSSVHGQTVSPADLLNTHFAWAVIAAFKEKNK